MAQDIWQATFLRSIDEFGILPQAPKIWRPEIEFWNQAEIVPFPAASAYLVYFEVELTNDLLLDNLAVATVLLAVSRLLGNPMDDLRSYPLPNAEAHRAASSLYTSILTTQSNTLATSAATSSSTSSPAHSLPWLKETAPIELTDHELATTVRCAALGLTREQARITAQGIRPLAGGVSVDPPLRNSRFATLRDDQLHRVMKLVSDACSLVCSAFSADSTDSTVERQDVLRAVTLQQQALFELRNHRVAAAARGGEYVPADSTALVNDQVVQNQKQNARQRRSDRTSATTNRTSTTTRKTSKTANHEYTAADTASMNAHVVPNETHTRATRRRHSNSGNQRISSAAASAIPTAATTATETTTTAPILPDYEPEQPAQAANSGQDPPNSPSPKALCA